MANLNTFIQVGANTGTFVGSVSTTGNITGGNLRTAGDITATGNVTSNIIVADSLISTTGNVVAIGGVNTPNVAVTKSFVFTGLSGNANLDNSANFSTTGNVLANIVSASGNVRGGNINTAGLISATGNVYANYFVGNISIVGNVQGSQPNVTLVAGSYSATFDNLGVLTIPAFGGDEGGEINLGIPTTNTTLTNPVKFDVFQNQIRFFDGSTKGAYIDLSQAATSVGTLLNNRVSGIVSAGTFVTMDNIKATVTGSSPRGLSLATVSGSFSYNIGGTYAMGSSSNGATAAGATLTTTPTTSIFGWNFLAQADTSTYIITDITNNKSYRITLQINGSYINNMISIERLI